MAQARDTAKAPDDVLAQALKRAEQASHADPDEADIAADDAGGTRLAESMEAKDETQAHPS